MVAINVRQRFSFKIPVKATNHPLERAMNQEKFVRRGIQQAQYSPASHSEKTDGFPERRRCVVKRMSIQGNRSHPVVSSELILL